MSEEMRCGCGRVPVADNGQARRISSREVQSIMFCTVVSMVAEGAANGPNGGYRTSVLLSRPSQRVTVITVTGQFVMLRLQVAVTADRDSVRAAKKTVVSSSVAGPCSRSAAAQFHPLVELGLYYA